MDPALLWQIGIGGGGLLAGLGLGFALRRPDRKLTARVTELEADLHAAERRYDEHRARVEKHFERTSQLFRDLTEHYTALYSHLAEGARELCPEGGPALGRGLDDPLLSLGFGAGRDEPEPELETDGESEAELEPEAAPKRD